MKIINNETGQAYQLSPGTELEMERTNPFFNDYGEQSLPVNLPFSEINSRMLGRPHYLGNKSKVSKNINVTIIDKEYVAHAKQAILSAKKKDGIPTSFLMNEGSFYATISDFKLKDVFGTETVSGISTVEGGINLCNSLLSSEDERFGIFPVYVEINDKKIMLNQLGWFNPDGSRPSVTQIVSDSIIAPIFYNSFPRQEEVTIEDNQNVMLIDIPQGFHMTPFLKVNYLLKRVFAYFGYTLLEGFLNQTLPFTKMVILNNTADAIANGVINYSDLVPDTTIKSFLNVIRGKFHCEFIPNEITKTVEIIFFKDIIASKGSVDISQSMTSQPFIDFSEPFKQIKIKSESAISDANNSVDSYKDLMNNYPTAVLNKADMSFYRTGFSFGVKNIEKVATSAMPYLDTEVQGNEIKEVAVPDCQPTMIASSIVADTIPSGTRSTILYMPILYIGKGVYLHSTLQYDASSSEEYSDTNSNIDNEAQAPMLAFYYDCTGHGFMHGTVSSYNYLGSTKLWAYSLCYFGEDGLFEKFYRTYDNLLRNSLLPVKADIRLSSSLKQLIKSYEKILMLGHELLINVFKYKIGGTQDPQEAEFFTTQLYEPTIYAQSESEKYPVPALKWQIESYYVPISLEIYEASIYRELKGTIFYPAHPEYLNQVEYFQYVARAYGSVYRLYTYHLKAVLP